MGGEQLKGFIRKDLVEAPELSASDIGGTGNE